MPSPEVDPFSDSHKDPLPGDESFPLRRTELDAALRAAGATRLTLVYFLRGGQTWDTDQGTVLHAWFRASTSQFLAERLDLQIYSVPKRLKKPISAALDAGGLWQVASWISSANGAENVWRASDHSIAATWEEGNLRITKLDGLAARPW